VSTPDAKTALKSWTLAHLPLLVTSLLGLVLLVMIPVIQNFVTRKSDTTEYTRLKESSIALNEGIRLAASEQTWDASWKHLRRALDTALTTRARLDAMLAIGELLLARAHRTPAEYALPARQYLRCVTRQEARPDRLLRAHLGLLNVARLQQETDEIREACAELHRLQIPADEKAAVLLTQLDAILPRGTWQDIQPLLEELLPYHADAALGAEIQLRWVAAHELMLWRAEFQNAWAKKQSTAGTAKEQRNALVEKLLATLDTLAAKEGPGCDEARFRAFRIAFREGRYTETSRRLDALRINSLGPFQREALLIGVEMARHENQLSFFHARVQQYVDTYGIDAEIEPSFFESLDLLLSGDKGAQGLAILEEKLEQSVTPALRARLLRYTGNLARKLRNDNVADRCFAAILNLPDATEYHPAALLARGAIAADQGEMGDACQWLIRYLNRFPGEQHWDDAAQRLFDQLGTAPEKAGADLILAALLLSKRRPYDAHTLNVLMMAADHLEQLGLTSMAHEYYNRIVLLQPTRQTTPTPASQGRATIMTMANIHCLLDLGRREEADRMLRMLCNNPVSSTARSEAALLWATLALERGQKQEGERRLGLIDPRLCSSNVAWQARVHRMILQVSAPTNTTGNGVSELLAAIHEPVATGYPDLVRKAFQTCFAALAARNDTAGLRAVLASAHAGTPDATQEEYRLQIAKQFLARKDYHAAAEWLQNAPHGLSNAVVAIEKNTQLLRKIR
jgi:hypothetical protein